MKQFFKTVCRVVIFICMIPFTSLAAPVHEGSVIGGGYSFNMPYDIEVVAGTALRGYVSSRANACVLMIDLSASKPYVTGQINVPGSGIKQAAALAQNKFRNELYVLDPSQKAVFVIDLISSAIDPSPIKVGDSPQNIIVSDDGVVLYVSASSKDEIHVINTQTRQSATVISLGEDADPYGLAITGKKLYVVGTWSQKVYVIDIDSQSSNYHKIIKTIAVGDGANDAVSNQNYVFISHSTADGKISVIDASNDTLKTSITVKNTWESSVKNTRGMTITGGILYAVNQGDSTLSMIDVAALTKLLPDKSIMTGGNGPISLAPSPDGKKLYCVHSDMGSVEILNIEHPVEYTLTVNTKGGCVGEVTSSPAGITCGSDCSEIYDWNASVALSVSSSDNCVFTGWSGGGCSGTGICTVKMNQNITVSADFSPLQTYSINVVTTGLSTGTVTSHPAGILCGIDCSETYPVNTTIILSAAPADGYKIKDWSGGGCEGSSDVCRIILKQQTSIFVNFEELPPKTLTAESTGKGMGSIKSVPAGIECGEICIKTFKHGTVVSLTAEPKDGYEFTGWSGACSGSEQCNIKMDKDATVKANFVMTSAYKSKAIIIAGGGPFFGNFLWDQTKLCAQFAFKTLLCQGFPRKNIYYLTEDDSEVADCSNNKYKPDKATTLENLKFAITSWASDAEDLVLYMVDHGGDNTFRLTEKDIVKADDPNSEEDLKGYLDNLQKVISGRVIVIYDACQSGSFISKLIPPAGKKRIVITSTNPSENAMFLRQGRLSFSYQFWTAIFEGAALNNVFTHAYDMMESFQKAMTDANGNGIEDGDIKLLSNIYIGNGAAKAGAPPFIETVSEDQVLSGQTRTSFSVSGVVGEKGISEVRAVILPPCFRITNADIPVTDLPEVIFQKGNAQGDYIGHYDHFTDIGEYMITIHAIDSDGFQSLGKTLKVVQTSGNLCSWGDVNKDGELNLKDVILALKILANTDNAAWMQNAADDADVNMDKRIGLEEIIYVMRKIMH